MKHSNYTLMKRAVDFACATAGLAALSPIFVLIAGAIKVSSSGPVFYRGVRVGQHGIPFRIFKFRTMVVDAERLGGASTSSSDARVTPIGRFLRAYKLDELPQLINVLMGDMSLVGPRPERPVFVKQFSKSIPNYMARHAVKAGITGWAQVNGWRGNSSLRRRVQFDLYYITHWNPLFDVRILVLTVWRMFFQKQKHAY